jgi:hypothetical protein
MGATGLYAYINNRAAGCAQLVTVRPQQGAEATAQVERIVLMDGNGLVSAAQQSAAARNTVQRQASLHLPTRS